MAGFNKMFVMLPVMLAARKLDGEDPNTIFLLRCAYGAVQAIMIVLVLYIYSQASALSKQKGHDKVVFVPPPPQPLADPNKKTYQEKVYGQHVISAARQLVGTTIFGVCMTVGLHIWKGMVIGLAIQSVMAPFNLIENALAKCILMGGGIKTAQEDKIFEEKTREELTPEDEIVDEYNQPVEDSKKLPAAKSETPAKDTRNFEDILLDTWDQGAAADIAPLMAALTEKNVNYKTKEDKWTPLMIMSGLGSKKTASAMRQMKALGADASIVDGEGWNALHWSAFHGSPEAAKVLLSESDYNGVKLGLHTAEDKEKLCAVDHAKKEGNKEVAEIIEAATSTNVPTQPDSTKDEGLRKRK
eukprot:CAMPEP_0185724866 /NCGR_PEP_ID=MMETSP1171-20130828/1229_1 /TAXON_ID=374046 /ORGANISM="Helicotheca tamensis, Strain CCMP826" /LENGTH=356 /DNA_ID=CAMNT_0028392815 /DNA_START=107 /DNA_END=1177 /DNA_ORIENTATION=-